MLFYGDLTTTYSPNTNKKQITELPHCHLGSAIPEYVTHYGVFHNRVGPLCPVSGADAFVCFHVRSFDFGSGLSFWFTFFCVLVVLPLFPLFFFCRFCHFPTSLLTKGIAEDETPPEPGTDNGSSTRKILKPVRARRREGKRAKSKAEGDREKRREEKKKREKKEKKKRQNVPTARPPGTTGAARRPAVGGHFFKGPFQPVWTSWMFCRP